MPVVDAAQKSSRRGPLIVISVFVVLFLVVVLIAQRAGGDDAGKVASPTAATTGGSGEQSFPPYADSAFTRRSAADPRAVGSIAAPVVVTMWTDFRCPFCAVFNRETLPDLMRDYVDTGKVRLEVRDVAFFGEESVAASAAALAAGRQGKFFDYMTAVYASAPERGHPDMPRQKLVEFARKAGVPDLDAFTRALDDPSLVEEVRRGTHEAQAAGVTSVPFFLSGGVSLSGAQPDEVFRSLFDASLDASLEAARPAADQ